MLSTFISRMFLGIVFGIIILKIHERITIRKMKKMAKDVVNDARENISLVEINRIYQRCFPNGLESENGKDIYNVLENNKKLKEEIEEIKFYASKIPKNNSLEYCRDLSVIASYIQLNAFNEKK